MRKADREIQEAEGILSILKKADVCRLGLFAEGNVYIVPLNFGFDLSDDGVLTLYFHCANEGRKLDMIAKNPDVCFEMDIASDYVPPSGGSACSASMNYASIIGNGIVEVLQNNDERILGLTKLMQHYGNEDGFHFDDKALRLTTVLRLRARSYTGKRRA